MNNTTIKDGGSAFPVPEVQVRDYRFPVTHGGMSLRDWFAGQALAGELASYAGPECAQSTAEASVNAGIDPVNHIAKTCYELADAMIRAREVQP